MVATKSCEILLGDPSHITQSFPQFQVQLLCCRYWWLKEWENPHQALPFWRIYHNTTSGGMISYNNQTFELSPEKIYLIPPETDYATFIKGHNIKNDKRVISGDLLSNLSDEQKKQILEKGAIGHLFIHFIILRPFIQVPLEVFEFDYDGEMKRKFEQIFAYLKEENSTFDLSISTIIYSLICILLSKISLRSREQQIANRRLTKMFYYINEHLEQSLTNDILARIMCITPNHLARLFKSETGETIQEYIRQKRIEYSCKYLLFSELSINEIAERTGFSNRYHFTRIFTKIVNCTPAKFKKQNQVKMLLNPPQEKAL